MKRHSFIKTILITCIILITINITAADSEDSFLEDSFVDVIVIEKRDTFRVNSSGYEMTAKSTMYFYKDLILMENDTTPISSLYNDTYNQVLSINHDKQTFSVLDKDNEDPTKTVKKIEVELLGKKLKIKDWQCNQYSITLYYHKNSSYSKEVQIGCFNNEIPLPDLLYNYQMWNYKYHSDDPEIIQQLNKTNGVDVQIETEYYDKQGKLLFTINSELVKIYKTKVDKSIFDIPKGYKKVKTPYFI